MNEQPTTTPTSPKQSSQRTGMVRCTLTGKELPAEEAYWAPPLITTKQLLTALFTTVTRTPGNVGTVLFGEQEDVPYAPDAREELAAKRTSEQVKLLLILLAIGAIIFAISYAIFS